MIVLLRDSAPNYRCTTNTDGPHFLPRHGEDLARHAGMLAARRVANAAVRELDQQPILHWRGRTAVQRPLR
jgi:hypothetical protein